MKSSINKVTGLQVGYTTEWVVLDSGEWRALTSEETSLAEVEYGKELLAIQEQEAKQTNLLALSQITVTTTSGKVFDGRDKDIPLMSGAIQAADTLGLTEHHWKLHDNTVQVVTLGELKEALALAMVAIGQLKTGG